MNNIIQQPRISTMTVEISVIKIGNNKMTLSVFDQLYEYKPHDEFNKIIYPVWGKVNRSGVDYVVFQKDNELKKWTIQPKDIIYNINQSIQYSIGNRTLNGYYLRSVNRINEELRKNGEYIYESDKFLNRVYAAQRNEIFDEFNNRLELSKSFNTMIDSLKGSNQLFIAA